MADLAWAEYVELVDRYIDAGMTDGLPVIPPHVEAVEAMLAATSRPPAEILGVAPPRYQEVTVRDVAINAVLAGCLPAYLPVVIAAVEVMLSAGFNPLGVSTSTKGIAPLIIVNGPVRQELGLNALGNLLGPGPRPNATIGRAVRFVLLNLGGAEPRVLDRSVLGHGGKYTSVIAEDEEHSPWPPLHADWGYSPQQSVVTLMACEAPHQILGQSATRPESLLDLFAESMRTATHYTRGGPAECAIILAPDHRNFIADAGWSKSDVQQYLFHACRRKAADLWAVEMEPRGLTPGDCPPDQLIDLFAGPEDMVIVAAGGPGAVSAYCWGFADHQVLGHSGHKAI